MSQNKLAGICFIVGAILNFIPIIVGVLLGGNPEEGAPIINFFYQNVIDGGAQSRLFAWMGTLSAALLAYAVYTLNSIEQSKEKNALIYTELPNSKAKCEGFERQEFNFEHYNIFSKKSLKILIKELNFKILKINEIREVNNKYTIRSIIR